MKLLELGNESIAFQTGAFFKELTSTIKDLRASGLYKPEEMGKYAVRLEQCIYKHSGITTSIRFLADYDNDFVLIPALTKGHVLNSTDWAKFVEKHYNADVHSFLDLERKGWIDPANSRVGGAFSDIVFKTYLGNNDMISKKYTPEESASVVLHEVGHAYTFLQFLADTVIVDTVMQRTYQELMDGNPDKKVKMIVTKAADAMQIENRDWLQSITDGTDKDTAIKVLASAAFIEPRKMDNKRFFSQDACEELAEIFAIRHGAGRALMTMRSKTKYVSYSYHYLRDIAWGLLGAAITPLIPVIGLTIVCAFLFSIFSKLGSQLGFAVLAKEDVTSFKQTATKIRNQFVEQIKTTKLPKQELLEIIESINLTDKTIQGYVGDFEPDLMMRFLDMFRRGKMEARNSREYTDKLERLSANDLFVRAAELSAK
jgi:hypothetical protein